MLVIGREVVAPERKAVARQSGGAAQAREQGVVEGEGVDVVDEEGRRGLQVHAVHGVAILGPGGEVPRRRVDGLGDLQVGAGAEDRREGLRALPPPPGNI